MDQLYDAVFKKLCGEMTGGDVSDLRLFAPGRLCDKIALLIF